MTNKIIRNSIVVVSLLGGMVFSGQASAASACKGLENNACASNNACSWVEGYQRKDGRQVKSFCRAKPAGKKKVAAQTSLSKTQFTKTSASKVAGK